MTRPAAGHRTGFLASSAMRRAWVGSLSAGGRGFGFEKPRSLDASRRTLHPDAMAAHIDDPTHAHELTFSCYRRYPFLSAERTCLWLVEAIDRARRKWGFLVWAYVFMPDHVHIIVSRGSKAPKMQAILAAIKQPVGRRAIDHIEANSPDWLPRVTRQRGDRIERLFWQPGGGYDRNIIEPKTLQSMMDYIHMNPVRRGLVDRPSEWQWSSARWYLEGSDVPLAPDPIPPEWCSDGAIL